MDRLSRRASLHDNDPKHCSVGHAKNHRNVHLYICEKDTGNERTVLRDISAFIH